MAKVTLRLYNREIESLIDHDQVEEAIAHCKHILQSYPKHIETYRLLAKAFLESRRYGEASDIFQRVLAAVPDDFVSQVGMSIIREDEGNLDGAIWHMERAFEVQPSNVTVQDELRRLYQRRDGVELNRIRLTRGALARMYAKGDLYQQAIAEIRATLVTEPIRPDLQVLLARMCFQAGQRIESTEICSELLSKYPYCIEANRILSQILPNTSRAEDAKIYLKRIYALDPYAAFLTSSLTVSKEVPENAIMIERLDYKPGMMSETEQPEWASSLGLTLPPNEPSGEPLPEWLSGIEKTEEPIETAKDESQEAVAPQGVPSENKESQIPDWMMSAGWMEATEGTAEAKTEPPVFSDEPAEVAPSPEGEAAPADIPIWLQEIAPQNAQAEKEMEKPAEPDWISENGTPDWLRDIHPTQETPEPSKETPITEPTSPASMDELPDWLKAMDVASPAEQQPEIPASEPASQEIRPEPIQELPQWLQELKTMAPSEGTIGPASSQTPEESSRITETNASQPFEIVDLPDWLSALASESGADEIASSEVPSSTEPAPLAFGETPEPPAQPAIDIPEWLQELGKEQPSTPASINQELSVANEAPQSMDQSITEAPLTFPHAEIGPQPLAETAPSLEDQDAALAWLEGLAAKHGADEETLYVKPEDRIEEAPAWVHQTTQEEPEVQPVVNLAASQTGPEDKPTMEQKASQEKPEEPLALEETTPEITIPESQPPIQTKILEMPEDLVQPVGEDSEMDVALAWLESLAAKQGADEETLYVKPEDRTEVPPEWVQKASAEPVVEIPISPEPNLPSVAEASQPSEETVQPEEPVQPIEQVSPAPVSQPEPAPAVSPAEDLPEWLRDLPTPELGAPKAEELQPSVQQPEEAPPVNETEVPLQQEIAALVQSPAEEIPQWLQELELGHEIPSEASQPDKTVETQPVQSDLTNETTPPSEKEESLPDWLQGFERPSPVKHAVPGEITTGWLKGFVEAPDEVEQPTPTETLPEPDQETVPAEPVLAPTQLKEERVEEVVQEPTDFAKLLQVSQSAFLEGKVEVALLGYTQLLNEGLYIEETIHDLRDALYRFPVDISIWQVLGDAYVRSNRLQDALDAFTKAEDLLR